MSVLTRKPAVSEPAGLRGHAATAARQVAPVAAKTVPLAQQAAQQAMPLARQAVPLARSAGEAARQGARQGAGATVAWATPIVHGARSWAAPQLEQSAHALSESIAPAIANALITAARKIDVPQPKPRRKARLLAVSVLLTAAGGAAAVAALRRRQGSDGSAAGPPAESNDGNASASAGPGFDVDHAPESDVTGNGSQPAP